MFRLQLLQMGCSICTHTEAASQRVSMSRSGGAAQNKGVRQSISRTSVLSPTVASIGIVDTVIWCRRTTKALSAMKVERQIDTRSANFASTLQYEGAYCFFEAEVRPQQ